MGPDHLLNPPSLKLHRAKEIWVGIDPGMSGAIGALNENGEFLWVHDMPILGRGREGEFDLSKLCAIVDACCLDSLRTVLLEWPQTRPDEAPESSKRFGVGLGILEGMFYYAGIPAKRVAPNKWKGRLGLVGKENDPMKARLQAVEMAETFIRDMPPGTLRGPRGGLLDGRAEALLIAWESLTETMAGLRNQPEDVRLARMLFGSSRRRKGKPRDLF